MAKEFKPERLEIDEILVVDGVEQSASVYVEQDDDDGLREVEGDPICRAPIGYARLFAASSEMISLIKRFKSFAQGGAHFAYPPGTLHAIDQIIAKTEGKRK